METFSLIAFCSGILAIVCKYKGSYLSWVFKPLTLVAILAMAFFSRPDGAGAYKWLVIAGLLFSLIGDTLLIDEARYFVYGLGAFLVAHVLYVPAFWVAAGGRFDPLCLVAYAVGISGFLVLRKGVPRELYYPVIAYNLVISTMLAAAINLWLVGQTERSSLAIAGAVLFAISDTILGINKFRYRFFAAHILILSTYFVSQWLIARSI
jgi:uncharacterized membrane protein YhhN